MTILVSIIGIVSICGLLYGIIWLFSKVLQIIRRIFIFCLIGLCLINGGRVIVSSIPGMISGIAEEIKIPETGKDIFADAVDHAAAFWEDVF